MTDYDKCREILNKQVKKQVHQQVSQQVGWQGLIDLLGSINESDLSDSLKDLLTIKRSDKKSEE